jgi:phosphatidylserine decarboxylase
MMDIEKLSGIIHKEGYVFLIGIFAVSMIMFTLSTNLAWICIILTIWCAMFFRNPDRMVPQEENIVVAPADGIVQKITEDEPPEELKIGEEKMLRVSIFLNIFNVHVNRIPASGKILSLHYHPGKFINASLDKASKDNERQSVCMETNGGKKIGFVQIAGLIARRIICDLEEEMNVEAGDRFGIIKFGSRLDLYLPRNISVNVGEGQSMVGGETIIADMNSKKVKKVNFKQN